MSTDQENPQGMTDEQVREAIEHRDVLLAVRSVLDTKSGKALFKYLFSHFEVGNVPPEGLEGNVLFEFLGFLRAGNSIYKLTCEADAETAASILAQIEKERYAKLYEQAQIGQS